MLKKALIILYCVVVVIMATTTFAERLYDTRFYDAWWFTALWALLAAVATWWFLQRRVQRPSIVALHLSFLLILLGAFLTHIDARQGIVHLRQGVPTDQYITSDGSLHNLPFTLTLDSFVTHYHEGTRAATDYQSYVIIDRQGQLRHECISMNSIYTQQGIRLYQSSFDNDGHGSILTLNADPWGIPMTYIGYALLFVSLVWMLFDPRGSYRQILRSPLLKKGVLIWGILLGQNTFSMAVPTLPKETAERFGQLHMLYNDRICPVQTYALELTKKLYGKRHYQNYTPEQVLTGFIFYGDEWSGEPIIRVKSGALKSTLLLPDYCSVNTFFNKTMGGYILGPYIQDYYQGRNTDAFHKQAAQMDDRLMLIMELREGKPLKLFPYTSQGTTTWYAPTESIDTFLVPSEERAFIEDVFTVLYQDILAGNHQQVDNYLDKLLAYQYKNGGQSIPASYRLQAERIYNSMPFATILFIVCLSMGFLSLGLFIWRLTKTQKKSSSRFFAIISQWALPFIMLFSFIALTLCLGLRWAISGNIPMSNGYETMLLMAWFIQCITLLMYRRFHVLLTFGFLLSGFFLLVSHISQMDPQIGHLMPVLNSPLLSIHVSIIMMSFALLSLTFICGLTALLITALKHNQEEAIDALAMLSRVFLYPALTTLGWGIFIGAIWANISWGTYWSWDPKEVWALITFMVYAVVVHSQSFPIFRRSLPYHTFITLAFLTILMTYFGVNYFLGGMHSYA